MKQLSTALIFLFCNNVNAESDTYLCSANNNSNCNQGNGLRVIINNQEYHKHYLTENENHFVCNASGYKSICAQGKGQTVTINGKDMTGREVKTDEDGNFVLY